MSTPTFEEAKRKAKWVMERVGFRAPEVLAADFYEIAFACAKASGVPFIWMERASEGLTPATPSDPELDRLPYTLGDVEAIEATRNKRYERLRSTVLALAQAEKEIDRLKHLLEARS